VHGVPVLWDAPTDSYGRDGEASWDRSLETRTRVGEMFSSPQGVVMPDGKLPLFNDSEEVGLYNNAPIYELAYENTHDPVLLAVLDNASRTSKESLLFGVAVLPEAKQSLLKSAVFPESGHAMLRAKNADLYIILKFGPHGGGHGDHDKLGEIVSADGRTQAVDPGTQLYGMALHKEWDQMSSLTIR
jgi:hypothetical protein